MEMGNHGDGDGSAELHVLPSMFGLPSFDPHCLAVLAYTKFGKARVRLADGSVPYFGILRDPEYFPRFSVGQESIHGTEDIIDRLRSMNYSADYELSNKECAVSVAFIEMMNTNLRPAVLHTYWLENNNFDFGIRGAYSASMPFPGNILYIRHLVHRAHQTVFSSQAGGHELSSQDQMEKKVYKAAVNCISYLSDKLGSKPFLLGNKPTTVDAIMFGYLAPILKINFPQNRLRGHLETFTNLCNTIDYILKHYFPPIPGPKEALTPASTMSDDEFRKEAKSVFIVTVFSLTVIVTYALLRGVISLHIRDPDELVDLD